MDTLYFSSLQTSLWILVTWVTLSDDNPVQQDCMFKAKWIHHILGGIFHVWFGGYDRKLADTAPGNWHLLRHWCAAKQIQDRWKMKQQQSKNYVLGLSFLLCNKTQNQNLSTGPGWSSEHFVFHISPAEHNLYRSRCPLFFFTYYKVSHMGNRKVSLDLGPGCGGCFFLISLLAQRNCKNSLAGYPNIFLLWIYQWELAGDPFQSRQAQVRMRPLSFSCRVVLSRTGLQPPLPKHLKISRIVNILSPLLYILLCFHMSDPTFLCHITDSILVIVKSRCHTKLCTAHERQWE